MEIPVKYPIIESFEPPESLNPKNVCFYSEHYKRLEGQLKIGDFFG
jgi:hypothetical protein